MRMTHVGSVISSDALRRKSPHVRSVVIPRKENVMFVRAVWRQKRLIDLKQGLRVLDVPTTRDALGLCGPDFQKMTQGLFAR
jgi:hypothetical protein